MRKILIGMVGTVLAGGLAFAQQETTQEEVSEYGDEVGEPTEEQQDPMMQTEPETQDPTQAQSETEDPLLGDETRTQEPTTWGEESGMQHSVAEMSAEELKGMTLVTETGEEVGTIERVGQERVVTVDVGGFLGIAEKTIAIPVTQLEVTSEGHVRTQLTKESIESRADFDERGFTEEGSETPETDY